MEPTRISLGARRSAALAAVAAAAALAFPAASNAAVTPSLTGDQLTLTGDGANDNITLTEEQVGADRLLQHNIPVAGGIESDNDFSTDAGIQSHLADGSAVVTVNAGGGNDTINLSAANIAGATINGEDGDDIIVGSAKIDAISGGLGSDRITGFRGNETINGDDGNDVMIWNNGDGNDVNEGGNGADETLITAGTADDDMKVDPVAGGRTKFERVNANFTVDMGTVERLNISSFAGADKLATAAGVTLPITVDAGPGNDTITGGDGADLLQGGDGVDTLNGGAGGDRILGNPGNDVMNGGGGDDVLVWNNGDGTDDMNGDDGLDRIENNLGAANDESKVKVDGGKVRYDRVNAPFGLNIASSEVLELNTFGGDDTLDVQPGVGGLIAIVADAGSGDDRLNGGDEADHFFGGLGNDTLEPGAGSDAVDGQAGDDTLKVRDGAGDHARGGAGTDSAIADAADVLDGVEKADVAKSAATIVRSKKITSKLRRGVYTARIQLECPATETAGCKGTLALQTAKAVRIGGVKLNAILATKSYALKAGQRKTVSVKLPKGVRKLSKKGKLSLRAVTTSKDAAGNVLTNSSKLSVKLVK
jgi:Ca2+-binding RTX toxin-like protein